MLATVPYLGLKAMWIFGSQVGLNDPEFGRSTVMVVANTLTAVMELVALVLAVIFFTRRGMRAPAWLVLLPMWVASGLLGQILISLPLAAVSPGQPTSEVPTAIQDWVYAVVYGGFALLGVGLLGAFALYARDRWSRLLTTPASPSARRGLVVAAAALVVAGLLQATLAPSPSLAGRLIELALAVGAAAALVATGFGPGATLAPRWAVVLAWVGTGAMAAWSLYHLTLDVFPNDLLPTPGIDVPAAIASVARILAGTLGVLALIRRLR